MSTRSQNDDDWRDWNELAASECIRVPGPDDDKYSRGVLGVVTGSVEYPGAAVLGVEAASRTGLGMVRYLGGPRATDLVLARRPEAVAGPGRVQAWLIGSGMSAPSADAYTAASAGLPTILDAGALQLHEIVTGPTVLTPHYRELARVISVDPADIAADPAHWAAVASSQLGSTVLLKGHTTWVAGGGLLLRVQAAPTWLATAGAGDALAGILGALIATHASALASDPALLARLAATASLVHGLAAERASGGGPLTILGLCAALPSTIASLVRHR